MPEATGRISSQAVREATGKDWDAWLAALDAAGAAGWTHKETAAHLATTYGLTPWWSQMVTAGYERARGKSIVGQTAGAGFEIGAQKTLPLGRERAWELLTSPRGLSVWLGDVPSSLEIAVGRSFTTGEGVTGTFRVVNPPQHLRLTWQPADWPEPSTVQVRAVASGPGKTSLRFHQEQLADERAREQMRRRWRDALAELEALAAGEG